MDDKGDITNGVREVQVTPFDSDSEAPAYSADVDGFGSNDYDKQAMQRMGKTQETNRNFQGVTLISFTCICMATWEWMIMSNTQGLVDGGRAGLFWSYLWTFVGYSFLGASLADMASMAPTAGGQYHWTSEFAPPKYQRVLSYTSGWLAALCWQAGNASGIFLQGFMMQALIALRNPSYEEPAWQGWLLTVATAAVCVFFNVWAESILPQMQNVAMVFHVGGFIATIAVLWAMAPHVSATEALLTFENEGGWASTGLSLMVGQLTVVFALGGSDSAAHMAEETKAAGLSVPRAMFWTVIINGIIGLIATISFIFAIPSVSDAVNDPSGFSMIYVFNLAAGTNGAICLTMVQLVLLMFGNIAYQAATARQTFAFARDGGFPMSGWISKVNPHRRLPVNAVLFSAAFTILISLINLGSSDAFNAILSLAAVAQMGTYGISISCVLYRRITAPHLLPKAEWGLGRWGIPVNAIAVAYAWFVWFWMFWPMAIPIVPVASMNWAIVMFFGVLFIGAVFYALKARKTYFGPVTVTEGWKQAHE